MIVLWPITASFPVCRIISPWSVQKAISWRSFAAIMEKKIVLYAQQLGLNTCWVGLTYSKVKGVFQIGAGEKLCCVIAIGYGSTQGSSHKSKSVEAVSQVDGAMPDWFRRGVEAALLAPTALNQQKFQFSLSGNQVSAKAGRGFYSKVDLGIVKYHFELGAGKKKNFFLYKFCF